MPTETTSFEHLLPDIEDAAGGPGLSFVQRLAERLGAQANARAVFGDPVERDGLTIIPVARISWGVGGGGGTGSSSKGEKSDAGEGGGGGGGMHAKPLGYIEIRDGSATFVKFRDPASYVVPVLAAAVSGWLLLRGLRSLFH